MCKTEKSFWRDFIDSHVSFSVWLIKYDAKKKEQIHLQSILKTLRLGNSLMKNLDFHFGNSKNPPSGMRVDSESLP